VVDLTETQKEVLRAVGHQLVTGEPGSGKTTVAILKGAKIAREALKPGQHILFLSFARATVSRVLEAIDEESAIMPEERRRIEVDTYHSFFWRILKTHGYLVGFPRRMTILTPPNEAIALAAVRSGYKAASKLSEEEKAEKRAREEAERIRLATEEGRVCFDLFADRNEIALPDVAFTADVYGGRINWALSTRFFTTAFVQYNAAADEVFTNVRLNYIHAPLSDLFLVYTERRDAGSGSIIDRLASFKVTKLVGF